MTNPAGAFIPVAHKAEKRKVKLKLGIQGPSGSGKTKGALWLATNLFPGRRPLVLDTENRESELYADTFDFDVIALAAPYKSDRYEACIDYAVDHGYPVLIIDTLSHQWEGEGGILRSKDALDRANPKANSYMNWAKFTPEHTHFIEKIKSADIHIIATMRSKQDYVLEKRGEKTVPVKVGMAPIVREGTDYEFSIVFDLERDSHLARVSKDRSGLFDGREVDLKDPAVGAELLQWLNSGTASLPVAEKVNPESTKTEKPKPRAARKTTPAPAETAPAETVRPPDNANLHGVDITDADLPENLQPKPTDLNRPPNAEEKKAIVDRFRGYAKVVGDMALAKWMCRTAGVTGSKDLTAKMWLDLFKQLDGAVDNNTLKELVAN